MAWLVDARISLYQLAQNSRLGQTSLNYDATGQVLLWAVTTMLLWTAICIAIGYFFGVYWGILAGVLVLAGIFYVTTDG